MIIPRAFLWTLTLLALALGTHLHDATQAPLPYVLLGLATLAPLWATFARSSRLESPPWLPDALLALAALGLTLELWGQLMGLPPWAAGPGHPRLGVLTLLVAACAVLAVLALAANERLAQLSAWKLLAVHLVLGVVVVAFTKPWIDVHLFHTRSIDALLAGRSPYGQLTPNMYGRMSFYAPEVLTPDGTQVHIGFPYPPLQLLLSVLPQKLLGDYRMLQAAAITGSAALMLWVRPGLRARIAIGLVLLCPWMVLVTEQGWTEPLLVAFFSLTIVAALRAPRMLPWTLAGLFGIKQYAVALAPLVFLLVEDRKLALKIIVQAGLLTAAVLLPFLLWDPAGFANDLVLFLVRQPLRPDSYNWTSLVWAHTRTLVPQSLAFVSLVAAVFLTLWKGPRGPLGFASGTVLAFALFFGFSKHAFYNYWYFVMSAAAWALVLSDDDSPPAVTA